MALKRARLVRAAPDPNDRPAIASRDAWLAHAIEASVPAGERAALERAILLLERLADADRPAPSVGR